MNDHVLIWIAVLTFAFTVHGTAKPKTWSGTLKTVVFKTEGTLPLEMDIYYPPGKLQKAAPAHIFIHGGGWTSNSRKIVLDTPENYVVDYLAVFELLAREGYVGVSVDYRLAGDSIRMPRLVEDVNDAVRFLHKEGTDYGIDSDRLAVWGSSAGGHLALMVGLPPDDAFPGDPDLVSYPSTVRCVVSWYGAGDFALSSARGPDGRANFKRIFGRTYDEEPELYEQMSPVAHLAQGAVPILLVTGEKDTTILPEQSESLHDRAQSLGLDSTYVLVKNSGHGWRPLGGAIVPSQEEIHRITADFMKKHTQ
jgi:acetyl esterase/lipase